MSDEITWERDHPITINLLQSLGRDLIRLSPTQKEAVKRIVGKMEEDLSESKTAQTRLQNHIIWHIEKNKQNAVYAK
jgi:hypothetical protein